MRLLRLIAAAPDTRVKPVDEVRRREKKKDLTDEDRRKRRHRLRNLHLPPDPDEPIGSRVDITI